MMITLFAVETGRDEISEETFLSSDYELAMLKSDKLGAEYDVYMIEFDTELAEINKVVRV